jgi:hypothetical protein
MMKYSAILPHPFLLQEFKAKYRRVLQTIHLAVSFDMVLRIHYTDRTIGRTHMPDSIHSGHRERIREQYRVSGAESFLDHQFLELLLTYAIPRREPTRWRTRFFPFWHAGRRRFGGGRATDHGGRHRREHGGVSAHAGRPVRRLLIRRTEDGRGNTRLNTPAAAARYAVALLSLSSYETVFAVCLNAKKTVLSCESCKTAR